MANAKFLNFKFSPHVCKKFFSIGKKTPEQHYNIIVAGGGMVGTAACCALAKSSKLREKSILLLEGAASSVANKKKLDDQYSNRVVSLNPSTRKFMDGIGVWQYIEENRFARVKQLQIWDANSDAFITFEHPGFTEDVSYIVENDVVLSALNQVLQSCKDATVKYKSRILDVTLGSNSNPVVVSLDTGVSYSCDLLIGAEGVSSTTRRAIGGQYLSWSYKQKGVVATLRLSEPTENVVAWQRFLPTGPIALLPLTSDLSSLVWTTTNDEADRLLKISEDAFVDAVNDALWKPLTQDPVVKNIENGLRKFLDNLSVSSGNIRQLPPSVSNTLPGSRACFPLGFGHATRYVAPGAVLIGDAAHRIHPLAGLGVNLGFADIETLVQILGNSIYSGEKLGSMSCLNKYQQQQQLHNFPIMTTIDMIQKLYNTNVAPAVLIRSAVMNLMNSFPPLKYDVPAEIPARKDQLNASMSMWVRA